MSDDGPGGTVSAASTPDQAEDMAGSVTTTAIADRIVSLDFIRGIAVLGILAANILVMSGPSVAAVWPLANGAAPTGTDYWAWLGTFLLIDGKMRGLFTLLFGAGLYLFMERAWARGATGALQMRRLALLFVFGLLHFLFLFFGDILMLYALWGMVVLAMLKMGAKAQFFIGLALYLIFGLFMLLLSAFPAMAEIDPGQCVAMVGAEICDSFAEVAPEMMAEAQVEAAIYGGDSYLAVLVYHATDKSLFQLQAIFFAGLSETLPLMLMGVAALRFGWFEGGGAKQIVWSMIGIVAGFALSAPLALWVAENGFGFFTSSLGLQAAAHYTRLPLILGLAGLLGAVGGGLARGWLGARFAAAGRVAFSNYVGTSLVMMVLFHGWAIGLYGELSRTQLLGVVAAAWVVMLVWSAAWLARYRYGPLEWLWRCLTYGKKFPLRR